MRRTSLPVLLFVLSTNVPRNWFVELLSPMLRTEVVSAALLKTDPTMWADVERGPAKASLRPFMSRLPPSRKRKALA